MTTGYEERVASDPTQQAVRERTAKRRAYVAEYGTPPVVEATGVRIGVPYDGTIRHFDEAYGEFREWDAQPVTRMV